jgi:predicted  nucleic acid-binding Zn-ribbon protein
VENFRIHRHVAFNAADAAFIEAFEALKTITVERGSLDERMRELQDSIARLERLVLTNRDEIRQLRERLDS